MKRIALLILILPLVIGAEQFSMAKAKRLEQFLSRIGQRRPGQELFLKKAIFTEDDLNSYLNLVYIKKFTPEVTYIKLNLKPKSGIEGNIKIKLLGKEYEKVPAFLRDITIDFTGVVESTTSRMRFIFEKLVINGTQYNPEVMDEIFQTAQINVKVKKSLFDWFTLLPGLKQIAIDEDKIICYY